MQSSRVQCSIACLMGLIVIVAIELAALQSATREWAEVARFVTVAALVMATHRARYSMGRPGAWWFGFALMGWASYLLGIDATRQWTSLDGYKLDSFLEAMPFRVLGLNTPPLEFRLADSNSHEGMRLYCQILIIQRISALFFARMPRS
jgi:hypothetical protein